MATINLANKFSTKLDQRFTHQSFTDVAKGTGYDWEGVNSITVWDLLTEELNDYNKSAASNRFGTPSEVDDAKTTYTLAKARSFSKVFDILNVQDTMFIRKAAAYMKQISDERIVPEVDKYRLLTWANGAGIGKIGSDLTKSTVLEEMLNAYAALDDALVPSEGRIFFVRSDIAVQTKLATELQHNDSYTTDAIRRGKIGEINGCDVISIPQSYMPTGVNFILKYKNATAEPDKLKMLRANDNAPGYAGTLMEGLVRYDSFVLANKADGIYVYSKTGEKAVTPTIACSNNSVTITASGATAIKYTLDGSNPKTSATAQTYSSAISITKDTKVRAYATLTSKLNSAIASSDVTYSA